MEWSSATLPSSPWLTVTSLNHELKKKKSLFSQITSAMHFIIVMKKVMLRVMLSTMGLYENVQNGIVAVTV